MENINKTEMNTSQQFHNKFQFTWKFTLFIAIILLLFFLNYFGRNNYSLTNSMRYFLLPLLLFFILTTIIGYRNWRARNLTLTEKGIITYHGFKAQRIIPWDSIQSMEYIVSNNIFKKIKAHLPIGTKLEIATIIYRDNFSSTQEKEIRLTSFNKHSGRFIFDLMEKQYGQFNHKVSQKSPLKLNEVIHYDGTINRSILLPILSFMAILVFCVILITTQDLKTLATFIAILPLLPSSVYSYLTSTRKIAIIASTQGIQDAWLHQNNSTIPWMNIQSIEINEHASSAFLGQLSSRYISIGLNSDHEIYMNTCTQWQRFLLKYGKSKGAPCFFVTENTSKHSLDDIHEMLTDEWQKHTKH